MVNCVSEVLSAGGRMLLGMAANRSPSAGLKSMCSACEGEMRWLYSVAPNTRPGIAISSSVASPKASRQPKITSASDLKSELTSDLTGNLDDVGDEFITT